MRLELVINNDWNNVLCEEFDKDYYLKLTSFIKEEYNNYLVFPDKADVFNAFYYTPFHDVKVVIIGQDPYHNENQAHGLCFSVKPEVDIPPSLMNIYKELRDDLGCSIPNHGYLNKWTKQGVFLLNTVLTVRAHEANSHQKKGWEQFTDAVIRVLNTKDEPMVFLLWGRQAIQKKSMLTNANHLVLESAHPSPLSAYRGFFGSKPFSTTNAYLTQHGLDPIDWQI